MAPGSKRVTLQTIADQLGVSRTTVSNAYSRPDQLNRALRDRILATARQLGYAGPDALARSLRRGRAGALGLLFTQTLPYAFGDPYAVGFLRGVAEVAEDSGTGLLLIPMPPGDEDRAQGAVRDAAVDGFAVYCVSEGHPALDVIRARGLPVVMTEQPKDPSVPFVGIDERAAARAAATHLTRLGHRSVAVIADCVFEPGGRGRVDPAATGLSPSWDLRERLDGFREALEAVDVDWPTVTVISAGRNTRDEGCLAAAEALDVATRPTAVLTVSDVLALGALDALAQRGLAAGRDVSVVGFDDVPDAARAGLTTIRQPMIEKGRLVAEILLDPEASGAAPRVVLPTELIVRSTTGPAPS
ncbi:MAG: LacI family DNA-binding transcriptional regulator [Carbonactinosporaceae bacterium]